MSQITLGIHPKLNRLFASKDEKKRMNALTERGWQRADMSLDQLAAHLDTGASAAAWYTDGHRCTDSARAQFVPLDMDKGNPDRQRIAGILDALNCAYVSGETGSSKPDDRRYRFIIPLAGQVADADQYRQLVERLIFCFPSDIEIDANSLKIGQPWFGHKRGTTHVKQGDFLTLAAIMALPAPPEPEKPVLQRRELPTVAVGVIVNWDQERSLWIAQEVMAALDRVAPVQAGRGKYQYRHCPNPAHSDKDPSFRVSYDKSADGIGQCSCTSRGYSMGQIAEWVNARDFKTWYKDERAALYSPPSSRPHEQKPAQQARAGQQGSAAPVEPGYFLPYTWRRGMVMINTSGKRKKTTGNLGLILECAILHGVKHKALNPSGMTTDEVIAYALLRGIEISPRQIRRVFDELKKVFLSVTDIGIVDDPVSLNDNNSSRKAGRPSQLWKLNDHQTAKAALAREMTKKVMERHFATEDGVIPPLDVLKAALHDNELPHDETVIASLKQVLEAAGELDKTAARKLIADAVADRLTKSLDDYRGEPIPDDFPMKTGEDYLAAHGTLRLKADYQGDVFLSQKQIGDALGIGSRKVVARVIRRVGVAVTPSTVQEITLTPDRRIYEQIESARSKVKGKALSLKAVRRDGTVIRESYSMAAAQRLMNEGAAVTVAIRTANMYAVTPDVRPIEAATPAPRVVKPAQQQEQPTAPRVTMPAPSIERDDPDHIGYSRTWLRDQLALILSRHDGIEKQDGRFISRETGEIASMDASAADLLGLLIGQHVEQPADLLIAFAEQEFGAVAYDMSKSG